MRLINCESAGIRSYFFLREDFRLVSRVAAYSAPEPYSVKLFDAETDTSGGWLLAPSQSIVEFREYFRVRLHNPHPLTLQRAPSRPSVCGRHEVLLRNLPVAVDGGSQFSAPASSIAATPR